MKIKRIIGEFWPRHITLGDEKGLHLSKSDYRLLQDGGIVEIDAEIAEMLISRGCCEKIAGTTKKER